MLTKLDLDWYVGIVCRVIYYLILEQDGFVFLAFAEISEVPLRVLSGSMRHNLSLVSVIFCNLCSFSLPWWHASL